MNNCYELSWSNNKNTVNTFVVAQTTCEALNKFSCQFPLIDLMEVNIDATYDSSSIYIDVTPLHSSKIVSFVIETYNDNVVIIFSSKLNSVVNLFRQGFPETPISWIKTITFAHHFVVF